MKFKFQSEMVFGNKTKVKMVITKFSLCFSSAPYAISIAVIL